MPKTIQEPTSSSVKISYPHRIWSLIFDALAKYQGGQPLTGLGYREFNEGGDRWTASVSPEFSSIHVYCEIAADERAELKRRAEGLQTQIASLTPRISAHIPRDSAAFEDWETRKSALEAEKMRCVRALEKCRKQLAALPGSIDETIALKELSALPHLEIEIPAVGVMGHAEREVLRLRQLWGPEREKEPETLETLEGVKESGGEGEKEEGKASTETASPDSTEGAGGNESSPEGEGSAEGAGGSETPVADKDGIPAAEELAGMPWGDLQDLAKRLDINPFQKKDVVIEQILGVRGNAAGA